MRHILVAAGLLLSTSAFAAAKAPQGNGNFRRAEVIKAAGVSPSLVTKVRGVANAANFAEGTKLPKTSRIMLVEHDYNKTGRTFTVTAVKAPLNLNIAPTKMTAKEMHNAGLITQAEAQKIAAKNGGILGQKGKVKLTPLGLSQRGSYQFLQGKAVTFKEYGNTYKATGVYREVTITGSGESASADGATQVTKKQGN